MLEAADLQCERGGRTLFRNLSLSLPPGELLRICGPNGSGKTSLIKILCGLLPPAAGEVRWQGRSIRSLREEYSRQLLYLGHAPAVKDELTAAENLRLGCTLAGLSVSAGEVAAAVGRFGIPADTALRQLSQGQRRRAALARLALSGKVLLWLLDEPFTALDAAAAELTKSLLREHGARGGTVVYTAHEDAGLQHARVIEL
jgi:heme exporter protein A